MLRSTLVLALAASVPIISFLAGAPASAQTLDGWQGFKFGLSPDQARKVPGFQFGRYSRKNLMDQNQGAMASTKPVIINGMGFKFDLWFNAFERLYEIALQNQKITTRAECEIGFISLLATQEKAYGEFKPVYTARKAREGDQMPLAIEWRKAGGPSQYQLATAYMGFETASVWNARKVYDARHYLDIAAMWSAGSKTTQAVCLTQIDYRG